MSKLLKFGFILLLVLVSPGLEAQTYASLFNEMVDNPNHNYSRQKIRGRAGDNNAYNFLAIGYYVNANNIMYEKTKERKYLENNITVLSEMISLSSPGLKKGKWLMRVASANQNASVNGKEHIISEGYFYRYLGEFIYIINREGLYKEESPRLQAAVKSAFNKWNQISVERYGDFSSLYHIRFHTGATWAQVALYLDRFYPEDNRYKVFYSTFDSQLKKALKVKKKYGSKYYVWTSTYPERFTKRLQSLKAYSVVTQDVTHGNHIVEYVITSVKIGNSAWTKEDLVKFSNTITHAIWDPSSRMFSDLVNGEMSKDRELKSTGWKQSDGWMKLMPYNTSLKKIYKDYYRQNSRKINNSSLSLQYCANLM